MNRDYKKLVSRLRMIAKKTAEDRHIAEFGPGGGNPNAKVEDHIEWSAADVIEELIGLLKTFKDIPFNCHDYMTNEQWEEICRIVEYRYGD